VKKTIGVLGGMGPEATAHFFSLIIARTRADRDQDHIPVIINCNPKIPDRTEAILEKGRARPAAPRGRPEPGPGGRRFLSSSPASAPMPSCPGSRRARLFPSSTWWKKRVDTPAGPFPALKRWGSWRRPARPVRDV